MSKIDRFSIKDLHEEVLREGSVSISVLESHIEN